MGLHSGADAEEVCWLSLLRLHDATAQKPWDEAASRERGRGVAPHPFPMDTNLDTRTPTPQRGSRSAATAVVASRVGGPNAEIAAYAGAGEGVRRP